jgi:hypothetical protein
MRLRMVLWIDLWERWVVVEGARTSMSRWKRSHQKGVESMEGAYAVVIAWTVWSCRRRKLERLRCLTCGSEVGGVMVGGVEDERDTTVPQVMGPAIAVSIEDGCTDVASGGGYDRWEFCGGAGVCWWGGVVDDIVLGKHV